ncbi:hypothetical protein GCM10027416_17540 [Okibacterium endophyticum]
MPAESRSPGTDDSVPLSAAPDAGETSDRRGRSRVLIVVAAVLAIVVVAAVAFATGRLSTLGDPVPANDSAEAGFARDMQIHHDQGVELSLIIRDLTDDEDVRRLAFDIATTQGAQSGMMAGWMQVWGLPQFPPEPSMTWMTRPGLQGAEHTHGTAEGEGSAHTPGDPMPGLATQEQIDELESLSGTDAEIMFLELMIAHHRGAVDMAEALLDRSTHPVVTTFAEGVLVSQQSEIDLMESMLAERGAPAG